MARMSAKDVAEKLGVNYVVASGLVTLLNEQGKAPLLDKVFHESGRGKPTRFYDIPETVTISFADSPAKPAEAPADVPVDAAVEAWHEEDGSDDSASDVNEAA